MLWYVVRPTVILQNVLGQTCFLFEQNKNLGAREYYKNPFIIVTTSKKAENKNDETFYSLFIARVVKKIRAFYKKYKMFKR